MTIPDLTPEILAYWQPKQLLKVPQSTLHGLALPESSKKFLSEVGLPHAKRLKDGLGVAWRDVDRSVPTVAEHFSSKDEPHAFDPSDWLVLGTCYDYKLICVEPELGRVYLLDGDPKRGFLDWFVNSSIEQFVYFLTRAMSFFAEARKNRMSSTELLRRELETVDEAAFARSTHWWPDFFAEVDRGML